MAQVKKLESIWLFSATGLFLTSEWLWKDPLVCEAQVVLKQLIWGWCTWWLPWWPRTWRACQSPWAAAGARRSGSLWRWWWSAWWSWPGVQPPRRWARRCPGPRENLLQHPGETGDETVWAAAATTPWHLLLWALWFGLCGLFGAQAFLRRSLTARLGHVGATFPTAQREGQWGCWGPVAGFIIPAFSDVTGNVHIWLDKMQGREACH